MSWPRPFIPPVDEDGPRPFWSVMMPTYNGDERLVEALRSVLAQDRGPEHMQIQVVDDHSTRTDPRTLVEQLAGDRVEFHRQPVNVGHSSNFNTCLARSRGDVVHLLHDDDLVLPGFYERLEAGFRQRPDVGAAFSRFLYADQDMHWHSVSPLESREPGVLEDWAGKIARGQRVTTPCMAVRRSVYEHLGGFDPRITVGGEDWEMWVRIAAHHPVWFEPEVLAVYRMNRPGSLTGDALGSARLAEDMLLATDIVECYLPGRIGAEASRRALRRARSVYARWATDVAVERVRCGDGRGALRAVKVAGRGVPAPEVVARLLQRAGQVLSHRLKSRLRG